ncbi:hypothetical protein KSP40_PGU007060 [Platanthera guangdongensis]|uniref:Protein FLX-like 3 n=1 Tax=Platanthera guangdongensis TaxID=2320717 RepID=A0ABR2LK79_9ASPA
MAGRNRLPRRQEPHSFHDVLQPPLRRGHGPIPLPSIEEEIAVRRDEIRRLRADTHLQVEENVALRREIAAAKDEIHSLGQLITKVRADKEARGRDLLQRSLELEKELIGLDPIKSELLQLKSEAQKMDAMRKELSAEAQNMSNELKRLLAENQQIPTLRAEIEGMREELGRARSAYEYEKKASVDQMEQRQVLDKNLASMAREVEKLRADRISVGNRGRGSGPGASYGDDGYGVEKGLYGSGSWLSYEHQGFPRR